MQAVIVGGGPIAYALARRLIDGRNEVTLVIDTFEVAEDMALEFPAALVIKGNGVDERSLKDAQAGESDALFAVHDDDSHNMAACLLAKERFGVENVVALATSCDDKRTFKALGIKTVCTPDLVVDALIDHPDGR